MPSPTNEFAGCYAKPVKMGYDEFFCAGYGLLLILVFYPYGFDLFAF